MPQPEPLKGIRFPGNGGLSFVPTGARRTKTALATSYSPGHASGAAGRCLLRRHRPGCGSRRSLRTASPCACAPSAVTAAGELPACPAPVMLRRRLTPLGKLVASALAAVHLRDEEPFVVASSWGDSGKSCQLVSEMTATGDVSPAGFTSSVHNAASGAAGIWLKNHAPAPAVSAGNFTTEAGLTESFLQPFLSLIIKGKERL